jgi:hypothetical protein
MRLNETVPRRHGWWVVDPRLLSGAARGLYRWQWAARLHCWAVRGLDYGQAGTFGGGR